MLTNLDFLEIRIENTNHCGYRCQMCPREKQTRKKGVMSLEDFSHVLDLFENYDRNIHLHGFGEPLLDKTLVEKVAYTRNTHPASSVLFFTTLGVEVKKGIFLSLADAGLSQIVISCYGFSKEAYATVHGVDRFTLMQKNIRVMREELEQSKSPFEIILKGPSLSMIKTLKIQFQLQNFIQWLSEMGIAYTAETVLHNYGEGRDFNTKDNNRVCSIVWGMRKEILQVTWDLKIIPCCFDFNASIVLGNLKKQSLEEIFASPEYLEFIRAHKENSLSQYSPCVGCERDFNPSRKPGNVLR